MNTKSLRLPLVASIACLTILGGCAASTPEIDTSPDAEVTFDGLYPIKGGTAAAAWARPGVSIAQYNKIIVQGVGIEYRPGGESGKLYRPGSNMDYFELTEAQKARFKAVFSEAFITELGRSKHFTIVDEPGPDVLLIKGALLDVVSFVPPERAGRSETYIERVGEATLVLEIRDSVSEAIFARAIDRAAAEAVDRFTRADRVSVTSDVKRMASSWARTLRTRLDDLAAAQE